MMKPAQILTILLSFILSTAYSQDFEATKKAAENGEVK